MISVGSYINFGIVALVLAIANPFVEAQDQHAVKEHYTGSFIQFPESIEYDPRHDAYFIHKGKLPIVPVAENTAWISVMSPNGNIIREDFGHCPLSANPEAYANLGAMVVRISLS